MRNITKEYLDKMTNNSFPHWNQISFIVEDVINLEDVKQLLQDFEVALLNDIDQEKRNKLKADYKEPKY